MYRSLARLPRYVKQFGPWHGVRLLREIERGVRPGLTAPQSYDVPGYESKIHLRPSVSDHSIFWQCIVMAQYDIAGFAQATRLREAYRNEVDRGARPVIIDCGGNVGLASLWFARAFPEAIIYTVEPDLQNFALACRNLAGFGDRVRPINGGIWNEPSTLRIKNPDAGSAAFMVEPTNDEAGPSLRAYTIDEICGLAGVAAPFIVKVDIEGAQSALFRTNTKWVERTHLIAVELDDWRLPWQGTSRSFFSSVSAHAFDYVLEGETIFCFRDFAADSLT